MKHKWIKAAAVVMLLILLPIQALAYTKLEKGASGDDVRAMQTALQSLGYSITTDGKYGPATVSVVKSFQRKHGLQADGIAGDKTLTLLYALVSASGNTPAAAVPAAPTLAPQSTGGTVATVLTGGASLNLRQYAASGAEVIATIPNGEKVVVRGWDAGWASVVYEGMAGYVMVNYLSFEDAAAKTPAPDLTPAPTPAASVVQALVATGGGSLNLRQSPNSSAKVLLRIPNGTPVQLLSRGSEWCAVVYQGTSGYVMSSFLRFTDAAPSSAPKASPSPVPTNVPVFSGETAIVATSFN